MLGVAAASGDEGLKLALGAAALQTSHLIVWLFRALLLASMKPLAPAQVDDYPHGMYCGGNQLIDKGYRFSPFPPCFLSDFRQGRGALLALMRHRLRDLERV